MSVHFTNSKTAASGLGAQRRGAMRRSCRASFGGRAANAPHEVPNLVSWTPFSVCFWSQVCEAHEFFHICRVVAIAQRTPETFKKTAEKKWRIHATGCALIFVTSFLGGFLVFWERLRAPGKYEKIGAPQTSGTRTKVGKKCPRGRTVPWTLFGTSGGVQ